MHYNFCMNTKSLALQYLFIYFFTFLHPIQGSRATQSRGLMSGIIVEEREVGSTYEDM